MNTIMNFLFFFSSFFSRPHLLLMQGHLNLTNGVMNITHSKLITDEGTMIPESSIDLVRTSFRKKEKKRSLHILAEMNGFQVQIRMQWSNLSLKSYFTQKLVQKDSFQAQGWLMNHLLMTFNLQRFSLQPKSLTTATHFPPNQKERAQIQTCSFMGAARTVLCHVPVSTTAPQQKIVNYQC